MEKNATPAFTRFTAADAPLFAQYAAMSVLAVIALPLLWRLSLPLMLFFTLLWLVRAGMLHLRIAPAGNKTVIALLLVCGAMVFSQLKTIFGAEGGVALLLLLGLLKAYESRSVRDWQVLLLAALFMTVITLLFSQQILNFLWSALCLYAVLVCLNLLEGGSWRLCMRQVGGGLLAALPFALVMFVAVPRLPEPILRLLPNQSEQAKTGLSETMRPGSISQMVENDEWAFNAVFDGEFQPQVRDLYWRTLIMDVYDGTEWRMAGFLYPAQSQPLLRGQSMAYELTLQDWKGHIPALDTPQQTEGYSVYLSNLYTVLARRSYAQLRRVRLQSAAGGRIAEELPRYALVHYTRLPADADPQTRALASELFAQSTGSEDFVRRVLDYLRNGGFTYTLNPPPLSDSGSQIDKFLFETRSGFCGHYASAFTVMMRAAGIPARVVTGYQGGEYNEGGGFWQVRSKDAHAWTEVWLPESREWLRVDPTTAVSAERSGGIEAAVGTIGGKKWFRFSAKLEKLFAQGQFYWQQWVVDYDADRQKNLFGKLGLGGVNVFSVFAVLLAGGLAAVFPMLWWWRVRLARQTDYLYAGWMRLKEKFIAEEEKIPAAGPRDFLRYLEQTGRLTPQLRDLVEEYTALRYRTDNPDAAAVKRWWRKVRRIKSPR